MAQDKAQAAIKQMKQLRSLGIIQATCMIP